MCGRILFRAGILLSLLLAVRPEGRSSSIGSTPDSILGKQVFEYPRAVVNADFDGDSRPDLAIGASNGSGYVIEIQLSTRPAKTYLTLAGGGVGTRLFAYDVDKDSCEDLVVTTATSLVPIAVYLGDGKGHFQEGAAWLFSPAVLDTPHRLEQGKRPISLVSLMPQTRFCLGEASDCVMAPDLAAGANLCNRPVNLPERLIAGNSRPRSPPLPFPL